MVEMELREIQINEGTSSQVIVLEEKDGDRRRFPIFIGIFEAAALDNTVMGRVSPRPMTHDLLCNMLDSMGAELEGVLVDELRDDVFYGKLLVRTADNQHVRVDSRPSDALVLAAKKGVPIYVAEEILEQITERDGG